MQKPDDIGLLSYRHYNSSGRRTISGDSGQGLVAIRYNPITPGAHGGDNI